MLPPTKLQVLSIFNHNNVTTLFHPPYSPDLSPPDYFLFPKLKMKLKGFYFSDVAEIQLYVSDQFKKVQKEKFSAAFQKLHDRAKACIYANGAYFELKNKYVFLCVFDLKKNQS
jgi:histone-lysine N-methyltransferase SETMAR